MSFLNDDPFTHNSDSTPYFAPQGLVTTTNHSTFNNYELCCGACDKAFKHHPIEDEYNGNLICDRTTAVDYMGDYWATLQYTPNGVPYYNPREYFTDYSGSEANIDYLLTATQFDAMDEFDFQGEADSLDAWRDQDPTVCTHATAWWTGNVYDTTASATSGYYSDERHMPKDFTESFTTEPATRNAYVEGIEGFQSKELVNEFVTAKYQERLLNCYVDKKTSRFRCGSIQFDTEAHDTGDVLIAECISPLCRYRDSDGNYKRNAMRLILEGATREDYETFTYSVIRHGNNHGPDWITSRDTFYKVHEHSCSGDCGATVTGGCRTKDGALVDPVTRPYVTTDSTMVEFLNSHILHCTNSECLHMVHLNRLTNSTTQVDDLPASALERIAC